MSEVLTYKTLAQRSGVDPVRPTVLRPAVVTAFSPRENRRLASAGIYANGWEVLIYETGLEWEACFFNHDLQHEHLLASSFDSARRRAEMRIDILEALAGSDPISEATAETDRGSYNIARYRKASS